MAEDLRMCSVILLFRVSNINSLLARVFSNLLEDNESRAPSSCGPDAPGPRPQATATGRPLLYSLQSAVCEF
jgi:hypothetical protein